MGFDVGGPSWRLRLAALAAQQASLPLPLPPIGRTHRCVPPSGVKFKIAGYQGGSDAMLPSNRRSNSGPSAGQLVSLTLGTSPRATAPKYASPPQDRC